MFSTDSYNKRERVPDSYNKRERVLDSYNKRARIPNSYNKGGHGSKEAAGSEEAQQGSQMFPRKKQSKMAVFKDSNKQ